ncbi:hybrid sensor histidine kinase/response regulator [Novosphingobium sp.]|uniref:ATP-binding response regulator n=1 Tax=Novosphingobium sp. TaxID=1874826 RepID=UPI0038B72CD2
MAKRAHALALTPGDWRRRWGALRYRLSLPIHAAAQMLRGLRQRATRSAVQLVGMVAAFTLAQALMLELIGHAHIERLRNMAGPDLRGSFDANLFAVFVVFLVLSVLGAWLIAQAQDTSRAAQAETRDHLAGLEAEIAAHKATAVALQRAREAADAANAAKSRYLVSVSHEIRSPLNSIYGYAQLLERGSDLAPQTVGKIICRSSEHLSNLVDGLLDIAQVEAGMLRLSHDTIRLPAFVEQLAGLIRPQASAKGLVFRLDIAAPLPEFVRGDQKRLKQVLTNLLNNAVKFTASGTVTLRVGWHDDMATFEVIDTGIGIPEADLPRLFTAFGRTTASGSAGQPGIGIGLAITATLVRVMGGEISVDSTVGAGSRFAVRLTLSEPVTQPVQALRAEAVTGYQGARRTVLVVDDDAAQAGVIETLLRPLGFAVHGARDGDTALAMARAQAPDVVLLDISMPGRTGWDTAQALRAMHGDAARIVMVSSDAYPSGPDDLGCAAHDVFLTKPIELSALLETLARLLDLRWTTDEGATAARAVPGPLPVPDEADLRVPEPALPFVAEIDALARIGNVRGVQARLAAMEQAAPAAAPLVARLREQLDAFDFKGLRETLRRGAADGS